MHPGFRGVGSCTTTIKQQTPGPTSAVPLAGAGICHTACPQNLLWEMPVLQKSAFPLAIERWNLFYRYYNPAILSAQQPAFVHIPNLSINKLSYETADYFP